MANKRSSRKGSSRKSSSRKRRGSHRRHSRSKFPKQDKLMEAIFKTSPYNVMGIDDKSTSMELFGEYKPMNPMAFYGRDRSWPFSPGSNARGLLSESYNPLKTATSDDPLFARLLDLNRKTLDIVEGSTVGTAGDPLKIKDVRPPPFLGSSTQSVATAEGITTGGSLSALSALFPQLGSMTVPLSGYRQRPRPKTLEEMTYGADLTDENRGVFKSSNYLAVRDTDGIDPSKKYLFVNQK
jgi:hypothetical protein